MTYFLKCDEPVYYRTDYIWTEGGLEPDEAYVGGAEGLDGMEKFYWITSTERDKVLRIPDIMTGEKVLQKLSENQDYKFEDVVEEEDYPEIQEKRPPQ